MGRSLVASAIRPPGAWRRCWSACRAFGRALPRRRQPISVEIVTETAQPQAFAAAAQGAAGRHRAGAAARRRPTPARRRRRPRRSSRSRSPPPPPPPPPPKVAEPAAGAAAASAAAAQGGGAQARAATAEAGRGRRRRHPSRSRPSRRSRPAPEKPARRQRRAAPDKPADVAKAEPKPDKPPTPPAPKQEESDFDALLRSVEQTPKRVQAPDKRDGKGTGDVPAAPASPARRRWRRSTPRCWPRTSAGRSRPAGTSRSAAQGIGGLRAELNIVMGPDGGIQSVVPMDAARMANDPCSAPSPKAPCARSAPARRSSCPRSPIRYGATSSSTSTRRGWRDERRQARAAGCCWAVPLPSRRRSLCGAGGHGAAAVDITRAWSSRSRSPSARSAGDSPAAQRSGPTIAAGDHQRSRRLRPVRRASTAAPTSRRPTSCAARRASPTGARSTPRRWSAARSQAPPGGLLAVEFRLWDVFAGEQMRGLRFDAPGRPVAADRAQDRRRDLRAADRRARLFRHPDHLCRRDRRRPPAAPSAWR